MEMQKFDQVIEIFLKLLSETLAIRLKMNQATGAQGRAAQIRQLTYEIDSWALTNLTNIVKEWPRLDNQTKILRYRQVIKYVNEMQHLESAALETLQKLKTQFMQDAEPDSLPAFITLAINAHVKLLQITNGLQATLGWIQTHEPSEVGKLQKAATILTKIEELSNQNLESQRRVLIAKL